MSNTVDKSFQCGPESDRRTFQLSLPTAPSRVAVFVSGGLDSALLYYLLHTMNKELGSPHTIVPLTILRKEGSKHYAKLVVAHVNATVGVPYQDPIIVGDNTLPEEKQVESGVREAWRLGYHMCYTGLIEQLPQFMVNWTPIPYTETHWFRAPFGKINKSHVVDLCRQHEQMGLYYVTHSCSVKEVGRCNDCNGCNERSWGFEQLNLKDLGKI